MTVYRLGDNIPHDMATTLTVGTYDGVHVGHRRILEDMKATARQHGERTVVVTFDPHPQVVLARADKGPVRTLTTVDQKLEQLAAIGIDTTIIIPFTKEFAATSPEDFIRRVIVETIGVRHFFVGYDHMFGKNRGGDRSTLIVLGEQLGFTVQNIDPVHVDGDIVSSTRIRRALHDGKVEEAAALLGRPYQIQGTVVRGDQRGRKLGIPTANIAPIDQHALLPSHGVYVVSSDIDGARVYGMANIGLRPTFTNDTESTLEVHYLDYDHMLYDRTLRVDFHRFIRSERRFEHVDMFLSQLREDRLIAAEFAETQHQR
jgi:riboflavin kinase/FMN adenylyltransferase